MHQADVPTLRVILIKHGTSDYCFIEFRLFGFVLFLTQTYIGMNLKTNERKTVFINNIFPKVQYRFRYERRNYILDCFARFCLAANFSVLMVFSVLNFLFDISK